MCVKVKKHLYIYSVSVCVCSGRECSASILEPLSLFHRCSHFLVLLCLSWYILLLSLIHNYSTHTNALSLTHTHPLLTLPLLHLRFFFFFLLTIPFIFLVLFTSAEPQSKLTDWLLSQHVALSNTHTHIEDKGCAWSADSQNTNTHIAEDCATLYSGTHTHTDLTPQ